MINNSSECFSETKAIILDVIYIVKHVHANWLNFNRFIVTMKMCTQQQ